MTTTPTPPADKPKPPSEYCEKHKRYHYGCPCMECDPDYYRLQQPDPKPPRSETKPEPSELAKRITEAVDEWRQPYSLSGVANKSMSEVISTAGLADLEAGLARYESAVPILSCMDCGRRYWTSDAVCPCDLEAKLITAERERDEAQGLLQQLRFEYSRINSASAHNVLSLLDRLATKVGGQQDG